MKPLPALLLLTTILIISCNNKTNGKATPPTPVEENTVTEKIIGKALADSLEAAGFFTLTNPSDIKTAKEEIARSYDHSKYFGGTMKDDSLNYTDNRFYNIDSETLFEANGLTEYLETVKISFDKLGLKFDFKNEKSWQDEKTLIHSIEINGKEYMAFNRPFSENDWTVAYINFIEILNEVLELQGTDERFYPIRSDNDGQMVLLNNKQFGLVKRYYPDDSENPKSLQEWSDGLK